MKILYLKINLFYIYILKLIRRYIDTYKKIAENIFLTIIKWHQENMYLLYLLELYHCDIILIQVDIKNENSVFELRMLNIELEIQKKKRITQILV